MYIELLDAALEGANAVVLLTAHSEFKDTLIVEYSKSKGIKAVLDTRGCLNAREIKAAGIDYRGIGR